MTKWAAEALKNWREGEKKKANELVGRVVFVDEPTTFMEPTPRRFSLGPPPRYLAQVDEEGNIVWAPPPQEDLDETMLPTKCHLDDIKRDEALAAEDEETRDEAAAEESAVSPVDRMYFHELEPWLQQAYLNSGGAPAKFNTHTLTEENLPGHDHNAHPDGLFRYGWYKRGEEVLKEEAAKAFTLVRPIENQNWIVPRLREVLPEDKSSPGIVMPTRLIEEQDRLRAELKEHQDEVRRWLEDAYPLGFAEGVDGPPSSGALRPSFARYR